MKRTILILCIGALVSTRVFAAPIELVMQPGMTITAQTKTGTIAITAGPDLKRTYAWEGASRSATLDPRTERWYGSLGAYYPGPGEHWAEHNGITRGVLQEGQQHFESEQQATDWLRKQSSYYPTVYRDDGLVVSSAKSSLAVNSMSRFGRYLFKARSLKNYRTATTVRSALLMQNPYDA